MKTDVRNKEFYEASKSFVIAALEFLVSCIQKGEKIPFIMNERLKIEKEGRFSTVYEQQPIFVAPLYKHRKELESIPEYQACIKAMTSDPVISKHLDVLVGFHTIQTRKTAEEYLDYLVLNQLPSEIKSIEFNHTLFDEAYRNLEYFFYNDKFPLKAVSPLQNFSCEDENIDLGDGLYIRKITIDEQEQLLNYFKWSSLIPPFEALNLRYAIELEYQAMKIIGDGSKEFVRNHQAIWWTIRKLATALRLFRTGLFGYNIVRYVSTVNLPIPVDMARYTSPYRSFIGDKYALTHLEVDRLRKFWEKIKKMSIDSFPQLDMALSRFNYAYERDKLEDKLIDFMVAFEALFFKEGEIGEFQHKLSTRVARLLEKDYVERKAITAKMNEFYNKRSKIVHGEKVELKEDFVKSVEDYLRRSISLSLEHLQTLDHNEFISRLDLE